MRILKKWSVYCSVDLKPVVQIIDASLGEPQNCFEDHSHPIDATKTILLENIYDNFSKMVYEWSVYCDTERLYVNGFTQNREHPGTCFNNINHVISKNPILLKEINNNSVRIQEEIRETGGYFKANSYKMLCPPGLSSHYFSYPHPVSVLSLVITSTDEHTGDSFDNIVGKNTTIGFITSDVSVSDTIINVSKTVIDNINLGFYVNLTDGVNSFNGGRVLAKSIVNGTISIETPSIGTFLATSPCYVQTTVKTIDNYVIGPPSRYEIGKDKIGGSYVPSNTPISVEYTNNGNTTKDFYAVIELLY